MDTESEIQSLKSRVAALEKDCRALDAGLRWVIEELREMKLLPPATRPSFHRPIFPRHRFYTGSLHAPTISIGPNSFLHKLHVPDSAANRLRVRLPDRSATLADFSSRQIKDDPESFC
jgi:hypothetical protein